MINILAHILYILIFSEMKGVSAKLDLSSGSSIKMTAIEPRPLRKGNCLTGLTLELGKYVTYYKTKLNLEIIPNIENKLNLSVDAIVFITILRGTLSVAFIF